MNKSNDTSKKIDEIVNTGAVAVNMDRRQLRSGESDWRREKAADADRSTMRLGAHEVNKTKEQLEKAKALLKAKKRARFKDFAGNIFRRRLANEGTVLTYKILSEANIPDVVSRLKGLENKNQPRSSDTTTFGVEDDEGNIMKVTVKSEQAKDFENKLALELGEIQTDKIYGYQKTNISMAELLYNLKNEFEIIDVEFPTIPVDAIYNADKASYDNGQNDESVEGQADMPPEGGEMGDMSDMPQDTQIPPEDSEMDDMDDMEGMDGDMEDMDDESVEEFSDEEPEGFESMYQSLIQMMMAQAQAAKAQAEAEAEKARAITAEFTAKAATSELQKEEELARMNAELEKQKEKEKEAKKLANLAKFRVQQGKDFSTDTFEGFKSPLNSIMEQIEGEALENEQMIRKQMTTAKQQYAISASDDPDTRAYKQQTLQATMDELNARLKKTKIATLYNNKLRQKNAQQPQQNNQGNQNQQNQQNNNNPNQRDAARGSLNTGQQSNNGGGV